MSSNSYVMKIIKTISKKQDFYFDKKKLVIILKMK